MSYSGAARVARELVVAIVLACSSSPLFAADKDLHGKDLSHKELANEDFSRADLSGANLQWANLTNASFRGANLQDADLSNARLRTANFNDADLRGAKLNKAVLESARFIKANMKGDEVFFAYGNPYDEAGQKRARRALEDAGAPTGVLSEHNGDLSLKEANLKKAKLHGELEGVDLRRADLRGADLSDAKSAEKANLRGAIYDNTTRWPSGFDVSRSGAVPGEPASAGASSVTSDKPRNWTGKWMIKAEKNGAQEDGILTINKDQTYSWDYSAKAQPIEGKWKTYQDGLLLGKGELGRDWLLYPQHSHPDRPDSAELKASDAEIRRWLVPIGSD